MIQDFLSALGMASASIITIILICGIFVGFVSLFTSLPIWGIYNLILAPLFNLNPISWFQSYMIAFLIGIISIILG